MKKKQCLNSFLRVEEFRILFSTLKISLLIFLITAVQVSASGSRTHRYKDSSEKLIRNEVVLGSLPSTPQHQVKGKIKDSKTGEFMQGVNVQIVGTSTGTITDSKGEFSLEVTGPDQILSISFIGYVTQRITVQNQAMINIDLVANVSVLDEVVVVGYSTQQRQDISGSISVVDVANTTVGPSQQIGKQLQGRAAGVTIVSTGQPGAAPIVRIRGVNTFGDNNPLYVIDGVPTQDVNTLNPPDIESIQVLKDAAAASIYGSRASNGVIIITTKRGKSGVRVDYNFTG